MNIKNNIITEAYGKKIIPNENDLRNANFKQLDISKFLKLLIAPLKAIELKYLGRPSCLNKISFVLE